MQKIILKIKGMTCSACSNALEKHLNKQEGIINANVNLVMAEALVEYEDNLTIDDLNAYVASSGYISLGEYDPKKEEKKSIRELYTLISFGIYSIIYFYISMGHMLHLKMPNIINPMMSPKSYAIILCVATIPYLFYGKNILIKGIKNIFYLSPNMDTLVTVGVISSFSYSFYNLILVLNNNISMVQNLYFESAAFVILFINIGKYIDASIKNKSKKAIEELVQITPESALLQTSDGLKEVMIDEIKVGDLLVVKPGMKFAVDGKITSGKTHTDESFITGESMPVSKSCDDKVYAGSINIDGLVTYKAEKIGPNSSISEIVHLVTEATNSKMQVARLADKISGIFVPFVFLIAICSFIINLILRELISDAINTFVTVLVVACPCSLGLATPLAIIVSVGFGAKNGILIKSSTVLESACKIKNVVFDKTGTLTYGNMKVYKIKNYSKYKDQKLLNIAASIEAFSNHPISSAFKEYKSNLEVKSFKEIAGIGITGKINDKTYHLGSTKLLNKLKIKNDYLKDEEVLQEKGASSIYLVEEKRIIGLIGIKDIIRKDAKKTVGLLKNMGIDVIMLSGDNKKIANIIASEVGINNVIAEVMPKEKAKVIEELNNSAPTIMVGDGINDAPSLAGSTIGISLSSASDIAATSADVILMHNNLIDVVNLIKISKKAMSNIKQNLFWAFFYNILMIPIALGLFKNFGITLKPTLASIAMMLSSITVILNALRIKNIKLEGDKNV